MGLGREAGGGGGFFWTMKERGRFDVSLLRISQGWLEVTNIINYNFTRSTAGLPKTQ